MENMQYAEELVREFLVFRGFTTTLQAFETELSTDIGKGFEVDKLQDLIFSAYIPRFQADRLVGLFGFFKQCFSAVSEPVVYATLLKLEASVLRCYLVYAMQSGKKDKVVEFFAGYGSELVQRDRDWTSWFAMPYLKNPGLDPQFRIYFSKEWNEALRLSMRNFFSEIFNGTRLPALLKISSEKITVNHLKKDIKQLNLKLSQLQGFLEEKEAQICRLRSAASTIMGQPNNSTLSNSRPGEIPVSSYPVKEPFLPAGPSMGGADQDQESTGVKPLETVSETTMSNVPNESSSRASIKAEGGRNTSDVIRIKYDKISNVSEEGRELLGDSEFPEVQVDFQETFLGHTSPISRCRFSASGNNIASASIDGTVRIWNYDSSTPTSRNATIYCGAEIMSLDWECKSDRLLLIGTADGGIKAWNVDAKRVVCDLNTSEAFPRHAPES